MTWNNIGSSASGRFTMRWRLFWRSYSSTQLHALTGNETGSGRRQTAPLFWGLLLALLVSFSLVGDLPAQVSAKVPVGYEKVDKDTPLEEGTLLQVYQSFKWNDVRILKLNDDGTVHVQFVGKPSSWDNDFKRTSLIISQKELDRLNGNAPGEDQPGKADGPGKQDGEKMKGKSSFGKSEDEAEMPVEPEPTSSDSEKPGSTSKPGASGKPATPPSSGGTLDLIPRDVKVVIGIPVRGKYGRTVSDATVVEVIDSERFKVRWESAEVGESEVARSEVYVDPRVIEILRKSGAEQVFASRAERVIRNIQSHTYDTVHYRIRIPVPKNSEKVTSQTPLRIGAKVGLNNYDQNLGRDRWWDATVLELNWDDKVRIRIDGQSTKLDGDIDRSCLIITQTELARLENIAKEEQAIAGAADENWEQLFPVPPEMQIVRGTPVHVELDNGPEDATVIDIIGDRLHVVPDSQGGKSTQEVRRDEVQLRGKVIEAMALPGTDEKLLRRAKRIMDKVPNHPFPAAAYLPPPDLPRNLVRVTDQTPLDLGQPLKVYSNGQFWQAQVSDLNWDGSVRVVVNTDRAQVQGDIERRCLVIDKGDLAALEKSDRAERSPFARSKTRSNPKTSTEPETVGTTTVKAKPASTSPAGNYKVVLKSFGKKKIQVAQAVSDLTGSEFGDTLTLLGSLPVDVQSNLNQKDADAAALKLRGAGGEVDIVAQ